MREIVKLGVFLLIVGAVAGWGISYVYDLTEPVIAEQMHNEKLAGMREVYSGAEEIDEITEQYAGEGLDPIIQQIHAAYNGGELVGVIYAVEPSGYSGKISLLVGFDIAGQEITGIKVLNQSETPGLGALCAEPWFGERFKEKGVSEPLEVVKQEPAGDHEIVAITASTITSKAVTNGVDTAREHFVRNFE